MELRQVLYVLLCADSVKSLPRAPGWGEGWVEGEVGDAAVELGWRTGADGHGDRMVDSQTSPCTHRTQISWYHYSVAHKSADIITM